VSLYFSKETEDKEGVLTGISVHYFDGVAPDTMIEKFIFSKDLDYDTIRIALHSEDIDVCKKRPLPYNEPYLSVILAEGKGRIVLPTTEDAAKESGEWAKGSCLRGMGTHWEHDIVGGSNFTFEAKNLFPIVPMYDVKDGSLNGIFFTAPAGMQEWDVAYCGILGSKGHSRLVECASQSNMWDGGFPGSRQDITPLPKMCDNFCHDNCSFTGATGEPPLFATMHWFFKNKEDITACTTGRGPQCKQLTASPSASPTKPLTCAKEGEASLDCGAKKGESKCCNGLVCHELQSWRCVEDEHKFCAGPGTLSKQCGVTWNKAAQDCCDDLICKDGTCVTPVATPVDGY